MSNSITLSPEQFVFAQDQELKTDSFKVSEAFGKLHKNVLAKIESFTDFPEFTKLNFKLCHKNNELQNGKPQPYYEMTKDGFMFLVMGFTGKKASGIKIAYINAFNLMHKKLFPVRNALVELPTVNAAQIGELFTLVTNKSASSGKPRAYYWSRFQNHFVINSYKNLPQDKFNEAMQYLNNLEGEGKDAFVALTHIELSEVIQQNIPSRLQGQLSLDFTITEPGARFLLVNGNGGVSITRLDPGAFLMTREEVLKNIHEIVPGYQLMDAKLFYLFLGLQKAIIEQDKAH